MTETAYEVLTKPPDAIAMRKCRDLGVMLLIEVRGTTRTIHPIPWENWSDDDD